MPLYEGDLQDVGRPDILLDAAAPGDEIDGGLAFGLEDEPDAGVANANAQPAELGGDADAAQQSRMSHLLAHDLSHGREPH